MTIPASVSFDAGGDGASAVVAEVFSVVAK
jgi:hypothetical protein